MAVALARIRVSTHLCDQRAGDSCYAEGSAVQRKRIARRSVLRERKISGDQFGCRDEIESCRGQHGHMQRLADVASRIRAIRMLVEEAAARREVQQNGAGQYR